MKQLFSCFFYLILLTASPVVAYSLSRSSDLLFVLQASVTDSYGWSEKNQKYSLQSSQFDFQILQETEENGVNNVIHKNSITDTSEKEVRYLSVSSPTVVHFESVGASSEKRMAVKAKMFEENESLSVYFSKKGKSDILNNMLSAAGVNFSMHQNQETASDYNCHIKKRLLICSISYVIKGQFKPDELEPFSSI